MPVAFHVDEFEELVQEEPHNKKILIEGDSWVSHPLLRNLSWQFDELGNNHFNILNLAVPGDTVLSILDRHGSQYKHLESLLSSTQEGYKWDMIFLSAAGNDIIGPEVRYYTDHASEHPFGTPPEHLLNMGFQAVIKQIAKDYQMFLDMRDASGLNATTPVVTHCYSYLQPRTLGTHVFGQKFNEGWLSIYLADKGVVQPTDQLRVARAMLELFRDALLTVSAARFLVADTLNVLETNGVPDTNYFYDEIHPNRTGFRKVAQHIQALAQSQNLWPS